MNWTISKQLWGYTFVTLSIVGILGFINARKAEQLVSQLDELALTQIPAVRNMTNADMMHDGLRGVLYNAFFIAISGTKEELAEIKKETEEKIGDFKKYISALDQLHLPKETKAVIDETKPALDDYAKITDQVVSLIASGKGDQAKQYVKEFDEKFKALETKMESLGDLIEKDSSKTRNEGKDAASFSYAGMAIGLFLSLFISILMNRNVTTRLRQVITTMIQVSKSVGELSKLLRRSSESVSKESEAQCQELQGAVAALHEFETVLLNTNTGVSSSLASTQEITLESGKVTKTIEETKEAMEKISDANLQIQNLNQVINSIAEKTSAINDIVFKTQLLSFNASIEAARAGQQGRGFAVVAEEVAILAKNSGVTATEIQVLLEESRKTVDSILKLIQDRVKEGSDISRSSYDSFLGITRKIQSVNEQVKSIHAASEQQSIAIKQTSQSVSQVDRAARSNQSAAKNSLETTVSLEAECQRLSEVVLDVGKLAS